MDYMGIKEREPEEESFPISIIKDRYSKARRAHVVIKKGVDQYAVKRVAQDTNKYLVTPSLY